MSAGSAGTEHDDVASTKSLNHKGHEGTRRKTKIATIAKSVEIEKARAYRGFTRMSADSEK
jgi:hypothetical protein